MVGGLQNCLGLVHTQLQHAVQPWRCPGLVRPQLLRHKVQLLRPRCLRLLFCCAALVQGLRLCGQSLLPGHALGVAAVLQLRMAHQCNLLLLLQLLPLLLLLLLILPLLLLLGLVEGQEMPDADFAATGPATARQAACAYPDTRAESHQLLLQALQTLMWHELLLLLAARLLLHQAL